MEYKLVEKVVKEIKKYCKKKGARKGEGVNNFVPHDCITAFVMAQYLTKDKTFDFYLAVAPEGFIYGYFFEKLGVELLSLSVNYPPTLVTLMDDLSVIQGKSVLIIEDDIIGGRTLRLVVDSLLQYNPSSLSLFLGHSKSIQRLKNVPSQILHTYIAEDVLDYSFFDLYVTLFSKFFNSVFKRL